MKKLILSALLAFALCIASNSFAVVRTVSNNPNIPAQYNNVQAAIDAASANDVIYVQGSYFGYSDFTVTKKLEIIGAGYSSNNIFGFNTVANNVTFNIAAAGSSITGFSINNINCNQGSFGAPSNITVTRCIITNTIATFNANYGPPPVGTSWIIRNNIIGVISGGSGTISGNSQTNTFIANNIIRDNVQGFTGSSILLDHNTFLKASNNALDNLFFVNITNNVFSVSGQLLGSGVQYCIFASNLYSGSQVSATSASSFVTQNNTEVAGTNLVGTAPNFVSGATNVYSTTFDYRLQSASAGFKTGADGTDMGIYGGIYSFPSGGASGSGFDTSAPPNIPQINSISIINPSLPSSQSLNVRVKAKVNN